MIIRKIIFYITMLTTLLTGCRQETGHNGEKLFDRKMKGDPVTELKFRPNIIWLVARDTGPVIPSFGDSTITTPSLDSLALEGVRFNNLYSVSAEGPPNRFALYTGLYPTGAGADNVPIMKAHNLCDLPLTRTRYEVVTPPDVKLLSQLLRENGYYCFVNDQENCQFTPPVTAWDDSGITASWNSRKAGQPFFGIFYLDVTAASHIRIPFSDAEMRFNDPDFPQLNLRHYSPYRFVDPPEWELKVPENPGITVPPYLPDSGNVRTDLRRMYSNILEMDGQVGNIINFLRNDHILDSTIVCWFSDCGGPLPRQKGTLYDGGIRIPMIMRFPDKMEAGTYDNILISMIDMAPTMLSAAGIKIPDYMQGQPFLGNNKPGDARNYIFAGLDRIRDYEDAVRCVRNSQYKYINNFFPDRPYFNPDRPVNNTPTMEEMLRLSRENRLDSLQIIWLRNSKPVEEFYDLKKDPYELNNLIDDASLSDEINIFRTACDNWLNSTGDTGHSPEDNIRDMFWPGGVQPKTENLTYSIDDQKVVLQCKTSGAVIGYQVLSPDSLPGNNWIPYMRPIKIKPDIRITAVAQRIGFIPGDTLILEFR